MKNSKVFIIFFASFFSILQANIFSTQPTQVPPQSFKRSIQLSESEKTYNLRDLTNMNFLLKFILYPCQNQQQDLTAYILYQILASNKGMPNFTTGSVDYIFECLCQKFNRIRTPERRQIFEDAFIDNAKKISDKTSSIIYTNIGSGMLFQDLILLTRLLAAGFTNITVNLIDPACSRFIHSLQIGISHLAMLPVNAVNKVNKPDCYNIDISNNRFIQFLRWFDVLTRNHFMNSQISFNLYADLSDYDKDCQNHFNNQSDFLIIADVDVLGISTLEALMCNAYNKYLKMHGIYGFLFNAGINVNSLFIEQQLKVTNNQIIKINIDNKLYDYRICFCLDRKEKPMLKLGSLNAIKIITLIFSKILPPFSQQQIDYMKSNIEGATTECIIGGIQSSEIPKCFYDYIFEECKTLSQNFPTTPEQNAVLEQLGAQLELN